jgi:hypothetical protein
MPGRALRILFLLPVLVGCDNVQRGLFSTAGESNRALSPHPGVVAIVSGEAYKPFNATNAPPQNLLYLAIVLRSVSFHF